MSVPDYLGCIQVVMVNTTLPANIGSAARAMHTMGLSQLTVVEPKLPIDDSSVSHAAGGLKVLNDAQVTSSLTEALQSCQLVFAASSRSRHLPRPVVTPTQAATIMRRFIEEHAERDNQSSDQQDSSTIEYPPVNIAILFGREDRGLTNEELAFADYHIQIQANPDYPVLNVAAAVQVIAGFIYAEIQSHVSARMAQQAIPSKANQRQAHQLEQGCTANDSQHQLAVMLRQEWDEPAITHQQAQQLNERLTQLMVQLQLANPKDLRALPQRLSRMTSRLQLDQKEFQLISAILAKLPK
ncbi:RNA methyltransferase [Psychrobacter pygoscelis]|uniref:RNA methyltransferase n=1 Tax=Psychrobacter pygoscelis TaxID=2488563 RepID=UPI001038A994|nr:TrmH family RNA methyltransferase [Psychrobacter pygoscelis]